MTENNRQQVYKIVHFRFYLFSRKKLNDVFPHPFIQTKQLKLKKL